MDGILSINVERTPAQPFPEFGRQAGLPCMLPYNNAKSVKHATRTKKRVDNAVDGKYAGNTDIVD
jgi:hypothetical protein